MTVPYAFRVGHLEEASALVRAHHYSRRPPANVQVVGTWHEPGGLFGDYGAAVAACFFSIPPTRWSEPVLELTRLVRRPDVCIPLTGLIAATCKHLGKSGDADLLVSFADRTQGHHGGIYQAASWRYGGARDRRMDGVLVGGAFYPGRTCNSLWGTHSPARLLERWPDKEIVPHFDEGKHLYWRPLSKEGRRKAIRLGLRDLPYPKPLKEAA